MAEATKMNRLPTLFLSHGGGPSFFADMKGSPLEHMDKNSKAAAWYKQSAKQLGLKDANKPKAILVISAHWESGSSADSPVRVTSQASYKDLYFDYYGFPKHTYELKWPAPGNPELSSKVCQLLKEAGVACEEDKKRNLDHGVFIPLLLMYPEADIPTIQLSLHGSLSPKLHLAIGNALQPLRDQGVLIIGSGFIVHDMSMQLSAKQATDFVNSVDKVLTTKKGEERDSALAKWDELPHARAAHPRHEHLLPLHVAAAAAGPSAVAQRIDPKLGDGNPWMMACFSFQ